MITPETNEPDRSVPDERTTTESFAMVSILRAAKDARLTPETYRQDVGLSSVTFDVDGWKTQFSYPIWFVSNEAFAAWQLDVKSPGGDVATVVTPVTIRDDRLTHIRMLLSVCQTRFLTRLLDVVLNNEDPTYLFETLHHQDD